MKNTYRFSSPIIRNDGKVVYGLFKNKPVFNPDFRWPLRFQRPDDAWVGGDSDEIVFSQKS